MWDISGSSRQRESPDKLWFRCVEFNMTLYKELGEAETCKTQTWHGYPELVLKAISTVSTQSVNQLAKNYNIKIQLQVDHSMCLRCFQEQYIMIQLQVTGGMCLVLQVHPLHWRPSTAGCPLCLPSGLRVPSSDWSDRSLSFLHRIVWLSCDIPLISYLHACQSCHFFTVALRSCRPQPFRSTACPFFLVHVTFILTSSQIFSNLLKSSQMVQKGVPFAYVCFA